MSDTPTQETVSWTFRLSWRSVGVWRGRAFVSVTPWQWRWGVVVLLNGCIYAYGPIRVGVPN